MSKMNKIFIALAIILWSIGIYFVGGLKKEQPSPGPANGSSATSDTVVITIEKPVPVIKYIRIPGKIDTFYKFLPIQTHNNVDINAQVATLDTLLQANQPDTDSLTTYGRLRVDYFYFPYNFFDLRFDPYPLPEREKIITKTVYVTEKCKTKWYEKKEIWAGAAVLIGSAITAYRK
jgi:hypothetical protein